MNANELADEFEEYLKEIEELPWGNHQILCDQAATVLRQFDLALSIIKQQQLKIDNLYENNARLDAEIDALKTHSVKELTDEEIKTEMGCVSSSYPTVECLIEFARAILRKAQDK